MSTITEKRANPLVEFKHQLDVRAGEFEAALPAHMPVERYMRVVMTAVQNNPDLLKVERRSLFNACMKAAQDGLLPDGREGAIVEFKDRDRGPIAQWMPMIAGLRKKVRNSGEIADWNAYVVYANDKFEFQLGDDPFIRHSPALDNRGKMIAAYSIARFKSGEVSREVMSIAEIEKVRAVSRSKDNERGPWRQWPEEMARKTVARRHSKMLPMSSDLDDIIRRDDHLYDMEGASDRNQVEERPRGLAARLDALVTGSHQTVEHDPETGEVRGDEQPSDAPKEARGKREAKKKSESQRQEPETSPDAGEAAGDAGDDAPTATHSAESEVSPAADDSQEEDNRAADAPTLEQRVATAARLGREAGMLGKMRRLIPAEYGTRDAAAEGREDEWKAWMEAHRAATHGEA